MTTPQIPNAPAPPPRLIRLGLIYPFKSYRTINNKFEEVVEYRSLRFVELEEELKRLVGVKDKPGPNEDTIRKTKEDKLAWMRKKQERKNKSDALCIRE